LSDHATGIFVRAQPLLKHHRIELKAAACIYLACRQNRVSRSYKEIAELAPTFTNLPQGKKDRTVMYLPVTELGRLCAQVAVAMKLALPPDDPLHYINRFGAELKMDSRTLILAGWITQGLKSIERVCGRSPLSVAAAALYLASQGSRSIKEVAETADISTATLHTFLSAIEKELKDTGHAIPVTNEWKIGLQKSTPLPQRQKSKKVKNACCILLMRK
jgi:transcription initiation factor TFIIB